MISCLRTSLSHRSHQTAVMSLSLRLLIQISLSCLLQRPPAFLNIPDEFPSAVRWYGNHFLDLILCIPNHNFYENISKGCYAPQMRQGLDKYPHRNGHVIKHKKDDFRVTELRFPNFRIRDFEPQEYSITSIHRLKFLFPTIKHILLPHILLTHELV